MIFWFQVPIIIPIVAVLMSAALVVLPIVYDPKVGYLGVLGFFALGVLVYIPFVYKKYRLPHMGNKSVFTNINFSILSRKLESIMGMISFLSIFL